MAAMTPEQHHLVQRVRALVDDEPDVREVSMFGGRAIMVNDKMIVSAGRSGDLLVHVAADRHETLLGEPGAEQAHMGAGRVMGPGWITVAPGSSRSASWRSASARTRRSPLFPALTIILSLTMIARPPNVETSRTSGSSSTSARTR